MSATSSNIHKAANLWQVLLSHQGFPFDCMHTPSLICLPAMQNLNEFVFQEVEIGRGNNAMPFHTFPKTYIFLIINHMCN